MSTTRIAFEISDALHRRTEAVIDGLRSDSNKKQHVPMLIDVVLEMTDAGLHFYFLHPLEKAGVGVVTRSAVELAIGTAGRALPLVVRKTLESLSDEQLLRIAEFIDRIVISEQV